MKSAALIIAFSLCLGSLGAAAESVPRPKLRPHQAHAATPADTPAVAVPVPRLRPERAPDTAPKELPVVAIPVPKVKPSTQAESPPPEEPAEAKQWSASAVSEARAACKQKLAGRDLAYRQLDPIGHEGGCGAAAPVLLSSVEGVALSPPATLTCDMAAALDDWISGSVKPAARQRLNTEVTEIRTATSYACRYRNNASSGKMSEHSKANALDMSGFSFAKSSAVSVGGRGNWGQGLLGMIGLSKDGSFLDTIRKDACSRFTTVLGPGSDPYHGDHFHVDVLQRKGGYRICQ